MKNIIFVVLIISLQYSCSSDSTISNKENYTIYYNGEILTMEGDVPTYTEAVVVSDGQIVFIGEELKAKNKFSGAQLYDLKGATITPGFIEPHLHPSLGSAMMNYEVIAPFDWVLPSGIKKGVKNHDEYIKAI